LGRWGVAEVGAAIGEAVGGAPPLDTVTHSGCKAAVASQRRVALQSMRAVRYRGRDGEPPIYALHV